MAYAAVISLKHTINDFPKYTIPHVQFLQDFLAGLTLTMSRKIHTSVIDSLDSEIRERVCKLEDVLDSYLLYHSRPPPQGLGDRGCQRIPPVDEEGVMQEIDSFLKTVMRLGEEYTRELNKSLFVPREEDDDAVLAIDDSGRKKSLTVGLSDQLEEIVANLLDSKSRYKTVSLVGMAGIGKTHLARKIYQHPIIAQHFDVTVWVKVGQKRPMKSIFVDILAQIERKSRSVYEGHDMSSLVSLLKQSLHGLRYLILLDDVWSSYIRYYLIRSIPNNERSRLVLTTRLQEAALSTCIHNMQLLSTEESWNLLWPNVFGEKSFGPQLEEVGRKIAENCEGLPLLILAVADILCGVDKTEDYWKKVAAKKTTTYTEAYDKISEVLYSSYEYLPQYLKACFLYMGVFPQSCEIPLPKLIHLWTTEDFLEPKKPKSLEDFCVECLEKLVINSLAIVCKRSFDDRIKSCKLHSAYWHLCVKEARKIKFLHVLNKLADGSEDYVESQRRLSIQNNILFGFEEVCNSMAAAALTTRSLLCTGEYQQYPVPVCFDLMFLKVLDAVAIRFYEFPREVLKLFKLKYLALTHNGKLPSSVYALQQLECLIVRRHHNIILLSDSTHLPMEINNNHEVTRESTCCLPTEIWNVQKLRHIRIIGSNLPNPRKGRKLLNLSTLYMSAHRFTEAVIRSIINLEKLGIIIELQPDGAGTFVSLNHLGLLHKLKSLKCVVVNPQKYLIYFPPDSFFYGLSSNLQKLSLNGLGYYWEQTAKFGLLPNLEMLKLKCAAFRGPRWKTSEAGKFRSLKFLLLEDLDLVHWDAQPNRFPKLQRLIIRHCYKLKMIPREIGAISTLKMIEIVDCSPSVVASAQEIQEKIKSSLQVVISSSWSL